MTKYDFKSSILEMLAEVGINSEPLEREYYLIDNLYANIVGQKEDMIQADFRELKKELLSEVVWAVEDSINKVFEDF